MQSRRQKKAAKQEERKKPTDEKDKKTRDEEKKEESESSHPRSAPAGEKRSLLPERMCINSDLLIKILNEITSLNLSGPLVILRPFKVLINWESDIKQRLSSLESKWRELDALADAEKVKSAMASEPNSAGGVATCDDSSLSEPVDVKNAEAAGKPEDKASDEVTEGHDQLTDDIQDDLDSLNGKPALRRLRLLVEFIDEHVKAPLKRLKEARQHQQVFFADLYHFFGPGDEVYKFQGSGSYETVQAYRVLQITGGRRFNFGGRSGEEVGSLEMPLSNELGSPLVISCINIDFDGREFRPITTTFSIREYTGERSTAFLPVCPTAFTKDLKDLKEGLVSRGTQFIELAQIAHKEYSGLTIEPIEDIESQVIVDFDTTFQANPTWAPKFDIQCVFSPPFTLSPSPRA